MKNIILFFILILTTQICTQTNNNKSLENGIDLFNQQKYDAAYQMQCMQTCENVYK